MKNALYVTQSQPLCRTCFSNYQ